MSVHGFSKDLLTQRIQSLNVEMENLQDLHAQNVLDLETISEQVREISERIGFLRNEIVHGPHGDQLYLTQIRALERRLSVLNSQTGFPLGELSARTATAAALPTRFPALERAPASESSSSVAPVAPRQAPSPEVQFVFGSRNQYQQGEFEVYRNPVYRNSSCTAHAAAFGLTRLSAPQNEFSSLPVDEILLVGDLAAAEVLNQRVVGSPEHLAFFEDLRGDRSIFYELVSAIPEEEAFGYAGVSYENGQKIIQLSIPQDGINFYALMIRRMLLLAERQNKQEIFVLMTSQGASQGLFLKTRDSQLTIEIFDSHGSRDLTEGRTEAFVASFSNIPKAVEFLNRLRPRQDFGDDVDGWQADAFNQINFYPLILKEHQSQSGMAIQPADRSVSSSSSSYPLPPSSITSSEVLAPIPVRTFPGVSSITASVVSSSSSAPARQEITLNDRFNSIIAFTECAIRELTVTAHKPRLTELFKELPDRIRREVYKFIAIANNKMTEVTIDPQRTQAIMWARDRYFEAYQLPHLLNALKDAQVRVLTGDLKI